MSEFKDPGSQGYDCDSFTTPTNQKPRECAICGATDVNEPTIECNVCTEEYVLTDVVPKEELDRVSKERAEYRKQLEDNEWKVETLLREENDRLTTRVKELEQTLKHDVDKIEAQYAEQVEALKRQLAEAKKAIAGWGEDAQAVRVQLQEARSEVERLKLTYGQAFKELAAQKERADRAMAAVEYAKKAIEQSNYVATMGCSKKVLAEIERLMGDKAGGGR